MPLLEIKAHAQCDCCGDDFSITIRHLPEETPWNLMIEAMQAQPQDYGIIIDDEFLCPTCYQVYCAANPKHYKDWRMGYQDFLDEMF